MSADYRNASDPFTRQLGEYWTAWGRAVEESMGGAGREGLYGAAPGMQSAGPWMSAIHDLARKALQDGLDSKGIVQAWRAILKQRGLWPEWFQGGAEQSAAMDEFLRPMLEHPALGPAREHIQRWQALGRLQAASLADGGPVAQLMSMMMESALEVFERRLRERESSGAPLASARELFDVWIDAAEQAWHQTASSPDFSRANADATHAQLRLQLAMQEERDRLFQQLGLPTRAELDHAHQRILSMERDMDAMRAIIAQLQVVLGNSRSGPVDSPATGMKSSRSRSTASRKAGAGKVTAAATKKTTSKKATSTPTPGASITESTARKRTGKPAK